MESPSTAAAVAAECLALRERALEIANSMTARLTSDPASTPDLLAEVEAIADRLEAIAREHAADYPHIEERVKAMRSHVDTFVEASRRALVARQQLETTKNLLALAAIVGKALAQAKGAQQPGRNDPCPCGSRTDTGAPKKFKRCHGAVN